MNNMKTPTILLSLLDCQIAILLQGDVLLKAGVEHAGWKKYSSSKFKHTAESIKKKIIIVKDRFEKVKFAEENPEQVKKFKKLLKRHSKTIEANLRENKIYDEEKKVAALYVETAKEMIRKIKEQLGD